MAKVLVVEDVESLNKAYAYALTKRGHKVVSAANGRDAITLLQKDAVDIILLDLLMPKMSGLDFLRQIPTTNRPKILVFSNVDTDVKSAYALGADAFMLKSSLNPTAMVEWVEENLAMMK